MNMKALKSATMIGALALVFGLAAGPSFAVDPYARADDTWISISGTVDDVRPDTFTLDYGDGMVTVEMDDGDRDADAYKLMKGDKVTVNGVVDDDFFEKTTIEASSVYVENLGTYFYASAVDEEDTFVTTWSPVEVSRTVVQGTVTDVDALAGELTIHTGTRAIQVEVDEMTYDPLDDEGYQKIEVGDRISVSGSMDSDLFEGRELVADSILTLSS
ncbi:MAG TPA: DUF5666 domain-containing protein [Candidatus Sulfomarinibacteraceae bacterium]|nr:DUF5666 domain-containing protein [Candidatus Sulfomarinibacteraceae bacterium]